MRTKKRHNSLQSTTEVSTVMAIQSVRDIKKQKHCQAEDLKKGDCWIGLSLASNSGLIITARIGKHRDRLLSNLVANTEGKTDCKNWSTTDSWGGYETIL